jgi:hypothetical protein
MRSRPVVLHVGMHKTGTTSLQTMIARNREHFTAQGLYYPDTGQVGVGDGQHNLAWELNGDERFDPEAGTIADLAEELRHQRPAAVLISSEDLEYLHDKPDRMVLLRRVLEQVGYSARVVITLREPSEYLESLYYELVLQGRAGEFDAFVTEALDQRGVFSPGGIELDYARLVGGFAGVFGDRALRVLAYDRNDAVGPVLEACADAIGTPLTGVTGWTRFNVRDDPERTRPAEGNASASAVLSRSQHEAVRVAFGATFDSVLQQYRPVDGRSTVR